jgi:hypothetical protein
MQEVTITLKLRVNDGACLENWVPQSIVQQLEPGEELLAYDDTEHKWVWVFNSNWEAVAAE